MPKIALVFCSFDILRIYAACFPGLSKMEAEKGIWAFSVKGGEEHKGAVTCEPCK